MPRPLTDAVVHLAHDGASGVAAALSGLGVRFSTSAIDAPLDDVLEAPLTAILLAPASASRLGDLTSSLRAAAPDTPLVVVVDERDEPAGLDALRRGADDLLFAPVDDASLRLCLAKLASRRPAPDAPPPPPVAASRLIGQSAPMLDVVALVRRVAQSDATVLVRGESGTGKELVAREIHAESARASGPLVTLNCAAFPENLLESELFGYEKGAFTGALRRKPGRIELAERGTLFLDEIGDVPLSMQVKLLRVLQEREIERLGGAAPVRVDVRLIAATHRPLEQMVREGTFREDLFYRLNVVPIWLPPLRARRDDIPLLAVHFCAQIARAHGKPQLSLDEGAIAELRRDRWHGNVRQLQNVIERLVVLAEGPRITEADVRRDADRTEAFLTEAPTLAPAPEPAASPAPGHALDQAALDAERRVLTRALEQAKGNRTLAARILGISRRTLYNKLAQLKIS